jgi:hypothetical protein
MPLKTEKQTTVTPRDVALTWFKKRHFSNSPNFTIDEVASCITDLALMHPKQISTWMDSVISYRDAEGFADHDEAGKMWDSLIARPAEYKATRRKLERGTR